MKQITILNDNMTYHLLIDNKSVWLNMAELVTLKNTIETAIQSGFKEGDFLLFEGEYDLVTIFAAYTSDGSWHEHASISLGSMELQTGLHITAYDCEGYKVRQASDEEKKILLDALDEHGYAWNPEAKKVEKKAKTSPASLREANLKPFCKVLARCNKNCKWLPAFFVRDRGDEYAWRYNVLPIHSGKPADFAYCIPFEGHENIAFTDYDIENLPL